MMCRLRKQTVISFGSSLLSSPEGKRRQGSDRGYSWRDLSLTQEELPDGMVEEGWWVEGLLGRELVDESPECLSGTPLLEEWVVFFLQRLERGKIP